MNRIDVLEWRKSSPIFSIFCIKKTTGNAGGSKKL